MLLTKEEGQAQRQWFVVDLENQVLGRAATVIASTLRGKNKSVFTRHVDSGDFVVVINAAKVRLTGMKWANKLYRRHTGYPGGFKEISAEKLREKYPERLVYAAVWGMIPKGPLGRQIIKKLKIFPGDMHTHEAQSPQPLDIPKQYSN